MQNSQDVSSFVVAFTGSHRYITDYLVEEVLGHQPNAVQSFCMIVHYSDCGSSADAYAPSVRT